MITITETSSNDNNYRVSNDASETSETVHLGASGGGSDEEGSPIFLVFLTNTSALLPELLAYLSSIISRKRFNAVINNKYSWTLRHSISAIDHSMLLLKDINRITVIMAYT